MSIERQELNTDGKLVEIPYIEDQSPDFDAKLKEKIYVRAPQNNLSPKTRSEMILSEWQVPCHCVLLKSNLGEYQLLHVQPNKLSSSLLTYEQELALKSFGHNESEAIVAKGNRSWFGRPDRDEIEDEQVKITKIISVDTDQWWRLLFDPETNEIWIDMKEKKILTKYRAF